MDELRGRAGGLLLKDIRLGLAGRGDSRHRAVALRLLLASRAWPWLTAADQYLLTTAL